MAQPLTCVLCESEPGALVVTFAHDGTTVIAGLDCLASFCAGVTEALTGVRLVATPDQEAAAVAEAEAGPHEEAPADQAGAKSEAEEAEETDAGEPADEEEASAAAGG